jgi:hypothetical protein
VACNNFRMPREVALSARLDKSVTTEAATD